MTLGCVMMEIYFLSHVIDEIPEPLDQTPMPLLPLLITSDSNPSFVIPFPSLLNSYAGSAFYPDWLGIIV